MKPQAQTLLAMLRYGRDDAELNRYEHKDYPANNGNFARWIAWGIRQHHLQESELQTGSIY